MPQSKVLTVSGCCSRLRSFPVGRIGYTEGGVPGSGCSGSAAGAAEAVVDADELVAATDFPRGLRVAECYDQVNRIPVDRMPGLHLRAGSAIT
ncbi:hypothetical protein AB0M34_27110 [Nocardia sp. NPDC050193]